LGLRQQNVQFGIETQKPFNAIELRHVERPPRCRSRPSPTTPIRLLPLPDSQMQAMRRERNANREDTQVENLCYEKRQPRA